MRYKWIMFLAYLKKIKMYYSLPVQIQRYVYSKSNYHFFDNVKRAVLIFTYPTLYPIWRVLSNMLEIHNFIIFEELKFQIWGILDSKNILSLILPNSKVSNLQFCLFLERQEFQFWHKSALRNGQIMLEEKHCFRFG